jgi:mannose-6-phosphate isomerase-like protein (cupin superfamily)
MVIGMANAGEVIEHPITGERITWIETSAETDGALLHFELAMAPRGFVAAPHVHPRQPERFEVKLGRIRLRVGKTERDVRVGEVIEVPTGTPHVWNNPFDEQAVVDVQFRPALDAEGFFESYFALANDGKVSPKSGMPGGLQLMAWAHQYRHEVAAPAPAGWLIKPAIAVLGPVAERLGYRGRYRSANSD